MKEKVRRNSEVFANDKTDTTKCTINQLIWKQTYIQQYYDMTRIGQKNE